jgi:uncharacterized OB-fold protein
LQAKPGRIQGASIAALYRGTGFAADHDREDTKEQDHRDIFFDGDELRAPGKAISLYETDKEITVNHSDSRAPLAARPIREGLMQMDPPRLLGSRCSACHTTTFPAREFCPACDTAGTPAVVPLSTVGTIYSYTVVHQAPAGRKTPYALAYVDLEDGVRVMAQVDMNLDDLAIGTQVRVDIRQVGTDGEQALIGYVFVPAELAKEEA